MAPPLELLNYAKEALEYGYRYRTRYELQVKEIGKINAKYDLMQPANILELIALLALGGIVGNITHSIFFENQVSGQIAGATDKY